MKFAAYLDHLKSRLAACEAAGDPDQVRRLKVSHCSLIDWGAAPPIARALEVFISHIEDLEDLENLERAGGRQLPTTAEIDEAVTKHGGIRAAARALGVDPSTVSRRLKVLRATPNLLSDP